MRNKLQDIRKDMGLTQLVLGQLMGMKQQCYSRLEIGKRELTIQQKNHLLILQILSKNGLLTKIISKLKEEKSWFGGKKF